MAVSLKLGRMKCILHASSKHWWFPWQVQIRVVPNPECQTLVLASWGVSMRSPRIWGTQIGISLISFLLALKTRKLKQEMPPVMDSSHRLLLVGSSAYKAGIWTHTIHPNKNTCTLPHIPQRILVIWGSCRKLLKLLPQAVVTTSCVWIWASVSGGSGCSICRISSWWWRTWWVPSISTSLHEGPYMPENHLHH